MSRCLLVLSYESHQVFNTSSTLITLSPLVSRFKTFTTDEGQVTLVHVRSLVPTFTGNPRFPDVGLLVGPGRMDRCVRTESGR